ncbi:MAG: S-layer homology domain-containing protein [Eubacteriales bacterium]
MKKILALLLTLFILLTFGVGTAAAKPANVKLNGQGLKKQVKFSDLQGHWAQQVIEKMQTKGIAGGYDDGAFRPNNLCTQAEATTLIDRALSKKFNIQALNGDLTDGNAVDEDSDVPAWAKSGIKRAVQNKCIDLKRFHSNAQMSRLEFCVLLAKYMEKCGKLKPVSVSVLKFNPFKDSGLISDKDYEYILALYKMGIIKGNPNGNFNPNCAIKRVEIFIIINALDDYDQTENDDVSAPTWDNDSKITAFNVGTNSVELKWDPADDNEKVTGYKITYTVNGANKVKTVNLTLSTKITGLDANEKYKFTVQARDAAGNWSTDGPSVKVTTKEANDTTNPTWPSGSQLKAVSIIKTSVTLKWPDATDNEEVTMYKIYQDGSLKATLDADENETTISGLEEGAEYTFKVKAGDDAGNWSTYLSLKVETDS